MDILLKVLIGIVVLAGVALVAFAGLLLLGVVAGSRKTRAVRRAVRRDPGLADRLWSQAEALKRTSIRLVTREPGGEEVAIGASRIGGMPDLPPGTEWPRWRQGPLSFIAQVNLIELSPFDTECLLPRSGMLSFFYDACSQPWGQKRNDGSGARVLYSAAEALERVPFPGDLPREGQFRPAPLTCRQEAVLPGTSSIWLEDLEWTDDEAAVYAERVLPDEGSEAVHRMFGYAREIQGPMEDDAAECIRANWESTSIEDGGSGAQRDMCLLFQIDSDPRANIMWGDTGRLYFWIRRHDLAARNFDRVWAFLQCY